MNVGLAVLLIFISSIFGSFSTLFFKLGAPQKINFKNKTLMAAIFLAAFSFLFYIYALKQAPLTFIYLTGSISYLWAVILAKLVLTETISRNKIIGICLLFAGIIIMHL